MLQTAMNYGLSIVLTIWLTKYILDNVSSKLEEIVKELQRVERELAVVLDYIKLNIARQQASCREYGEDDEQRDRDR